MLAVFILHALMFGFVFYYIFYIFSYYMYMGHFTHIVVFSLLQSLQGRRNYLLNKTGTAVNKVKSLLKS